MTATFAIEPDVPRDPLGASDGPQWGLARRLAVLSLPLDERTQALLDSLRELDDLLDGLEGAISDSAPFALLDAPTEDGDESALNDAAIELSPDEISDADQPIIEQTDIADNYLRAGQQDQKHRAEAMTIVLSGPDIKRKIRHKQSIMPSYIAQVLYEDIGALFEIGDREGALVSLERLLTVAPISPQIEQFLTHNEARLLEYYESVLGPWSKIAAVDPDKVTMPPGYFRFEKMLTVVNLLDGSRRLSKVMADSGLRAIESCAVLSQLARSGCLDLGKK